MGRVCHLQSRQLEATLLRFYCQSIMSFFKPTRKKILFFVLFLVIELAIFFLYSLYLSFTGASLSNLCLPHIGDYPPEMYKNPSSLLLAWKVANAGMECGNAEMGYLSPLVHAIIFTQTALVLFLVIFIPYLLSCFVTSFSSMRSQQKKQKS